MSACGGGRHERGTARALSLFLTSDVLRIARMSWSVATSELLTALSSEALTRIHSSSVRSKELMAKAARAVTLERRVSCVVSAWERKRQV